LSMQSISKSSAHCKCIMQANFEKTLPHIWPGPGIYLTASLCKSGCGLLRSTEKHYNNLDKTKHASNCRRAPADSCRLWSHDLLSPSLARSRNIVL